MEMEEKREIDDREHWLKSIGGHPVGVKVTTHEQRVERANKVSIAVKEAVDEIMVHSKKAATLLRERKRKEMPVMQPYQLTPCVV